MANQKTNYVKKDKISSKGNNSPIIIVDNSTHLHDNRNITSKQFQSNTIKNTNKTTTKSLKLKIGLATGGGICVISIIITTIITALWGPAWARTVPPENHLSFQVVHQGVVLDGTHTNWLGQTNNVYTDEFIITGKLTSIHPEPLNVRIEFTIYRLTSWPFRNEVDTRTQTHIVLVNSTSYSTIEFSFLNPPSSLVKNLRFRYTLEHVGGVI